MFLRTLEIIGSSFKMALQELWKNKLRTFLSLFGITIGIFCIIGVLTVVNSLEHNIKNEVNSLGSNTIYIDKWEYTGGGQDYPWWKFVNRPSPKYSEVEQIKERTPSARYATFRITTRDVVEYRGSILSNINYYGISEDFDDIQPFEIVEGRYLNDFDFDQGLPVVVVGWDVAEKLFAGPQQAIDKEVVLRGKNARIIGVMKKQGKQMIGGWDFDQSIILAYRFARTLMNELRTDPLIMVQGQENLSSKVLKDELTGTMRALHKLSPTKEDDFALNDINDLTKEITDAFSAINIGGWAIAALSLVVGMFGVANIMFVTVRERTSQIGLKMAVGAKRRIILIEFLLESAFLCIIGGLIGLLLVFVMSQILTSMLSFPVFISTNNMILAVAICIIVGVLAGLIPASQAARMDPVVAIRSK
ncbi:MAG: ABC transporter permease [Chitinophagaceae bacterium]|nr:ABC transporter permease [Chitinophagaceae bacterium]